ncbi:uncharacterized protein LOC143281442 [Babylonia areolata]|uniref:uncharacterized protein LOC143281442 n=1 Tax=Babylonia areolata TaxID=304850 RepID=UPI003FCFB0A3
MQRLPQQHQDYIYFHTSLKAPLATFDTIDLGDEDVPAVRSEPSPLSTPVRSGDHDPRAPRPPGDSPKIGGAQSKGRGGAGKAGTEPHCQLPSAAHPALQNDDSHPSPSSPAAEGSDEEEVPTPTNHSPTPDLPDAVESQPSAAVDGIELDTTGESSSDPSAPIEGEKEAQETAASPSSQVQSIGKIQGAWLKHQDSDSSSSSGSGCDTFTFRPIKGSASASATQDDDEDDDDTDYTPQTQRRLILRDKSNDYSLNLYPEGLDPGQIASPSKRKAYEKRLQRLQVKTSPIVRPRSTTPINVVTLEEYISSSPDTPASPFQEKLKISLPNSEFPSKVKSPRSARKQSESQTESCFVFNEEILFSHTRSALVVDEVGHVPPSPRRVLIPPTLSPSTSPKLGRAADLKSDSNPPTELVYFKGKKEERGGGGEEEEEDIFGQPATQGDSDWATFSEADVSSRGEEACGGQEERHIALSSSDSDSDKEEEEEEILTVNIDQSEGLCKPSNIQVVLSAASSSTPSPSTPDSDEAIKAAATVISQQEKSKEGGDKEEERQDEATPRPPPIPPRRRPPPPPPQPPPPPDVVPGDEGGVELSSAQCDLLVDISTQ